MAMLTNTIEAEGIRIFVLLPCLSASAACAAREALTLGYIEVIFAQNSMITADTYVQVMRAIIVPTDP